MPSQPQTIQRKICKTWSTVFPMIKTNIKGIQPNPSQLCFYFGYDKVLRVSEVGSAQCDKSCKDNCKFNLFSMKRNSFFFCVSKLFENVEWSNSLLRHFKIQMLLKINCCMAVISAFCVTQVSQISSLIFRNRIQGIALLIINYTVPKLCSIYAVATLMTFHCIKHLVLTGLW